MPLCVWLCTRNKNYGYPSAIHNNTTLTILIFMSPITGSVCHESRYSILTTSRPSSVLSTSCMGNKSKFYGKHTTNKLHRVMLETQKTRLAIVVQLVLPKEHFSYL